MLKTILAAAQKTIFNERACSAICKPGQLIKLEATGEVIPHNVASGLATTTFAMEDSFLGKTINDDYVIGDLVRIIYAQRGDIIYARVYSSAGETVSPGMVLDSNGNGTLKVSTASPALAGSLVAIAEEEVAIGATSEEFMKVTIL